MLRIIRWIVTGVLVLGIPAWIYLVFFANKPVFPAEEDVSLGEQTKHAIQEDPEEYPLLSQKNYPEAYEHLNRVVQQIVTADEIKYADIFAYDQVRIIHKDDVLNAFATPGGFIYVYSGLIRYLDAEDHLAGVLGHEIAHAERRHSSLRMQKEYGSKKLLQFALWNPSVGLTDVVFGKILADLTNLDYSRGQEAEADRLSVHYLADTDYACDGTAAFFQKILDEGEDAKIPEFLSDHPASEARIADIESEAEKLQCSRELADNTQWTQFQNSLPPVSK